MSEPFLVSRLPQPDDWDDAGDSLPLDSLSPEAREFFAREPGPHDWEKLPEYVQRSIMEAQPKEPADGS